MTSHLDYSIQPLYGSMKNEDLGDWPTCQFCFSKFNSRDEWKTHTFEHFTTKNCSNCNVHLIRICDDWFELHSTTKCQSNGHWIDDLVVKQEPIFDTESQQLEHIHNDESDSELNAFGETFATDFKTPIDDDNSNAFAVDAIQMSNDYGVEFLNNANDLHTFKVTNVSEISNRPKNTTDNANQRKKFQCKFCDKVFNSRIRLDAHFQSHHNSRGLNTCRYCGHKSTSFEQLDKHIRCCTLNNRKRGYFRSHPHRPQFDITCDLCGKIYKTFRSLIDHMNEVHLRKSSMKCRICGKSYPSRYYLQKHLNRHKDLFNASGNGEAINDDLDSGLMERKKYRSRLEIQRPEALTCDECGRQFKHHYRLVEHKSSQHMAKSEFECQKCKRCYPNRYYLQKHLKRHAAAEACGIPVDSLAVDLDDGLMQRNRYIRMGPNEKQNSKFACDDCGHTFSKFSYLTHHRRRKHGFDNDFQCQKCGSNHSSRYDLEEHYKQHEKEENESELNSNFTVDDDVVVDDDDDIDNEDDHSKNTKRKKYVRNHPHQPKTEFICEMCDITFKRYDSVKEHMTSKHLSKESFKCNKCNRMYPNRYYLQKHMKRHQSGQPQEEVGHLDDNLVERNRYFPVHPHRPTSKFVCDFCNKTLSSYYSIREHMHSKHANKKEKKRHPCLKCSKTFSSKKSLGKHRRAKHTHISNDVSKSKVKCRQMCSTCGRLFADRQRLKEHEESHLGIMSTCKLCDRQFIHKNYLRKHMRSVHSAVRPFHCNIDGCEWSFAYRLCLKRHQARKHGMVTNRNACPICSKEFPDSTYHLKRHLKAHANNTAKEYIPEPKPNVPVA